MPKPYQHHDAYHNIGKAEPHPKQATSCALKTRTNSRPITLEEYIFTDVKNKHDHKARVVVRRLTKRPVETKRSARAIRKQQNLIHS